MQIDVLTTIEQFSNIKDDWLSLYEVDPDASLFLSWHWLNGAFKNHPGRWRVLAARLPAPRGNDNHNRGNNGRHIGFFPIRFDTVWSRRRSQFRHEIHAAGSLYWGEYTGFLVSPDDESDVITAFADHIKTMQWSKLALKYLRASDVRRNIFTRAFSSDKFQITYRERRINDDKINNLVSPFVELPTDFEDYLTQSVSTNSRARLRRAVRHFEADDSLSITTTNELTFEHDLSALLSMWTQRWKFQKEAKRHAVRKNMAK